MGDSYEELRRLNDDVQRLNRRVQSACRRVVRVCRIARRADGFCGGWRSMRCLSRADRLVCKRYKQLRDATAKFDKLNARVIAEQRELSSRIAETRRMFNETTNGA